jgi:hypothetical protein
MQAHLRGVGIEGDLETRQYGGDIGVELENSDQIGHYDFTSFRASYSAGEQRLDPRGGVRERPRVDPNATNFESTF